MMDDAQSALGAISRGAIQHRIPPCLEFCAGRVSDGFIFVRIANEHVEGHRVIVYQTLDREKIRSKQVTGIGRDIREQ